MSNQLKWTSPLPSFSRRKGNNAQPEMQNTSCQLSSYQIWNGNSLRILMQWNSNSGVTIYCIKETEDKQNDTHITKTPEPKTGTAKTTQSSTEAKEPRYKHKETYKRRRWTPYLGKLKKIHVLKPSIRIQQKTQKRICQIRELTLWKSQKLTHLNQP